MSEEPRTTCDVCGESIEGGAWLILNRYAFGTGRMRVMSEVLAGDEYVWHQDEVEDEEACSGWLLHWPNCARDWIDAKMVEADAENPA